MIRFTAWLDGSAPMTEYPKNEPVIRDDRWPTVRSWAESEVQRCERKGDRARIVRNAAGLIAVEREGARILDARWHGRC